MPSTIKSFRSFLCAAWRWKGVGHLLSCKKHAPPTAESTCGIFEATSFGLGLQAITKGRVRSRADSACVKSKWSYLKGFDGEELKTSCGVSARVPAGASHDPNYHLCHWENPFKRRDSNHHESSKALEAYRMRKPFVRTQVPQDHSE